ncbi:MAG: TetR/AcrR family transcriptional regulator C-terminal domain-containing protein [Lachnospiraceae bacterium]|nr:TetR/AcrR family transcriptional regulator C-terminal domain-containing protein [Lachnospiraceae bacterium]
MEKNTNKGEQAFINALLSLMEEKPYNQISVSELSELAEYDRRTYYRYFTSKDDILFSHCSALLAEMAASMSATPLTPKSGFLSFFKFWNDHRDFLALLYKQNLIHFLGEKLDRLLYQQVGLKVHDDLPDELTLVSEFSRYAYYFTLGGLWHVLVLWIRDGMTLTPEQLTAHVLNSFSEMQKMNRD